MVASIGKIASSTQGVGYSERDGYYARDDRAHKDASAWAGKGAESLGLSGPVDPAAFRRVLEGEVLSGRRLGRKEFDGIFCGAHQRRHESAQCRARIPEPAHGRGPVPPRKGPVARPPDLPLPRRRRPRPCLPLCSSSALVFREDLADRCPPAGITVEWDDLIRDLDRLQPATIGSVTSTYRGSKCREPGGAAVPTIRCTTPGPAEIRTGFLRSRCGMVVGRLWSARRRRTCRKASPCRDRGRLRTGRLRTGRPRAGRVRVGAAAAKTAGGTVWGWIGPVRGSRVADPAQGS